MFHPDIWKLITKFCIKHSGILIGNVVLSAISRGIETLIIPKLLAKIFTEINDIKATKKNVMVFIIVFALEKIIYLLSNMLYRKIEPLLTSFLTVEFIEAIFRKYEATHYPINVAVCMEKINILRETLESLVYYVYKLIPLFIVLIVTVISVFKLNIKLGCFVLASIVMLVIILYFVPKPPDCTKEKDAVYMNIEDIFNNMEFISCTEGGIAYACKDVTDKVKHLHTNRGKSSVKISYIQALGYGAATIFYVMSVAYLYKLYADKEISAKNFEAYILILGQLYRLTYDMSYHLPDFIQNHRIMNSNAAFVTDLFSYKCKPGLDVCLDNCDIVFDKVSFSFEDKIILKNFSCHIEEGSILCLFGTSGSGKTTFTNLVVDILQPDKGKVMLGGYDLTTLSKNTVKCHVANVRQNTTSLLQMSIYHNIIFGMEDTLELREQIESIIEEYNLKTIFNNVDFLDMQVSKSGSSLSGGQKQIIHFLHAIISETAKIIILDEPTSALDENTKKNILRLIQDLNSQGRTILIITHDASVLTICSTAFSFASGRNPCLLET